MAEIIEAQAAPATVGHSGDGFRADIEGIRAIAILAVVGFHAGVPQMSGGFVGVDVFFVLSGFLITRVLVRRAEQPGPQLVAFWAGRVRRLAPAMFVAVAATMVLCLVVYSPLFWPTLSRESLAAATYTSNLHFGMNAQRYFGADDSPLLHIWSLAVEEQFYLVWPLVVLGTARLTRSRPLVRTRVLAIVLACLAFGSFSLSLLLTSRGTPWAFYASPARAWEFAAGGLLGIANLTWARRSLGGSSLWTATRYLGFALVIFSVVSFDGFTEFPGVAALVPVVGSLLIIGFDEPMRPSLWSRLVESAAARWLGRLSYSWYLWHWPFIVVGSSEFRTHSTSFKMAAALVSLVPAWASFRFVEQPLRFARHLRRPNRALGFGVLLSSLVVIAAIGVRSVAHERIKSPRLAQLQAAREGRILGVGPDETCRPFEPPAPQGVCWVGPANATRTVALVGDSHAAQWLTVTTQIASDLNFRLVVLTYGNCPPTNLRVRRAERVGEGTGCLSARRRANAAITQLRPEVVMIGQAAYLDRVLAPSTGHDVLDVRASGEATSAATADYSRWLIAQEIEVVALADYPYATEDPIECLARERNARVCDIDRRSERASWSMSANELNIVGYESAGVEHLFRPHEHWCDSNTCAAVVSSVPVYADSGHLSKEFTISLSANLAETIAGALGAP